MVRVLWHSFDSGGNTPPSLGIARALRGAGHEVVFTGRPELAERIRHTPFRVVVSTQAYTHADRYAWHPRDRMYSFLTSPAVGAELLDIVARERPDVVVVDAMCGAALAVAPRVDVPVAVMLHTFLHRTLDGWHEVLTGQSEARVRCGFDPLPDIAQLWSGPELFHVNALAEHESPARVDWTNISHGAPIFEGDLRAAPVELPWARDDRTPVVLVTFSTAVPQGSVGKLQRTLDALAGLPVHVVATSAAVDPRALSVPANTHVVSFGEHDPLMERAAAVVTHGGFGTAMKALRHGLPMVVLTGRASDQVGIAALDQPCVAAFVEECKIGRDLPADASAAQIRAAVAELLDGPEYRSNAQRLAGPLRASRGDRDAARALLALTSSGGGA